MTECPICGSPVSESDGNFWTCTSCGMLDFRACNPNELAPNAKAKLAVYLRERNTRGKRQTVILGTVPKDFAAGQGITVDGALKIMDRLFANPAERMNRALLSIGRASPNLGQELIVNHPAMVYAVDDASMAFILDALKDDGYITSVSYAGERGGHVQLTLAGHERIAELQAKDSAMDPDRAGEEFTYRMGEAVNGSEHGLLSEEEEVTSPPVHSDENAPGLADEMFETLSDTYQVVKSIGDGGAGKVFEVTDGKRQPFALKVITPDKLTEEHIRRFKNELSFCLKTEHPNILKVLDSGFIQRGKIKCPFYVMRLYPKTLRKLMQEGIPPAQVLRVFSQILDGAEAAHRMGIWHRDLKPENILCDPTADNIVVADFGIAHFSADWLQTAVETGPGDRLANFQYAAPEQRQRGKQVDQRADIYALGMMLNEMFTKEQPHGTGFKTIAEVSPEYAYLDSLVHDMMRQAADQRVETIEQVKNELIGRGNEFISRQKLSELKKTVMPETEPDDPLINEPVRIVGVDYREGRLRLKLNHNMTGAWLRSYANFGGYTYLSGLLGPKSFSFERNMVSIGVDESLAQKAVDYLKSYLEMANKKYKSDVLAAISLQQETKKERIASESR